MKRTSLALPVVALATACGARTGFYDFPPAGAADASASSSSGGVSSSSGSSSGGLDASRDADGSDARDANDGSPPLPPSCVPGGPGVSDCGPASENCCTTLPVPAGTFFRTYRNDGTGPTMEADPATVSGLNLDEFEVTVGRFRSFAAAWNGGYRPPQGSGKHAHLNGGKGLADTSSTGLYEPGWNPTDDADVAPTDGNLGSCGAWSTWTSSPGDHENLPVDCLTWAESYAFCIWDGGFLPSEAEWEFAAAGGSQQREYPWGSTDPGTRSQYAIYGCFYDPPETGFCDVKTTPGYAPVGTAPLGIGVWGQLDLGGNVWETTLDAFAEGYVDPCVDGAYLAAEPTKVVRGGCFISDSSQITPPTRYSLPLPIRNNYVGFRCARAP